MVWFAKLALALVLLTSFALAQYEHWDFLHCQKDGKDYTYIKHDWCISMGAVDSACNGPCLDSNRRYCMYNGMYVHYCKFKDWCEQDGYKTWYKNCGYGLGWPTSCSEDGRFYHCDPRSILRFKLQEVLFAQQRLKQLRLEQQLLEQQELDP
ncbi:hypothetical protein BC940DRAFT_317459 [Gongronella butleri]|nr:hypothetical protein BC940DRAFT_317459 [Gongronella butleri]